MFENNETPNRHSTHTNNVEFTDGKNDINKRRDKPAEQRKVSRNICIMQPFEY